METPKMYNLVGKGNSQIWSAKMTNIKELEKPLMDCNQKYIVVGIVGPFCSGVSTIAQYIASKFDVTRLSLAKHVKDVGKKADIINILKREKNKCGFFDQTQERQILQSIGNYICKDNSAHLAEQISSKINLNESTKSYIVTGFRRFAEVTHFREKFGDKFFLIGVEALSKDRVERFKEQNIGSNLNEESFYFEDERDRNEYSLPHGQSVSQCYYSADYFIHNPQCNTPLLPFNLTYETQGHIDRFFDIIQSKEKPSPSSVVSRK